MTDTYQSIAQYCKDHDTRLIAVSKTKPISAISQVYDLGHRDFGENRVKELVEKQATLPSDIYWHMIGHLQTNKVKHIAPFVHMIHSGDRLSLLAEVNKQAQRADRQIDLLLQIKIAQEEEKYGWDYAALCSELDADLLHRYPYLRYRGVMGMATFTDEEDMVRTEFRRLREHFEELRSTYFSDQEHFDTISMGMSGDYKIAIEEGSTMIRVGSLIFGERG